MQPYVVQEIPFAPDGEVIEQGQTAVRRPAPFPRRHSAAPCASCCTNVVAEGGGRNAYMEGYSVGGKTGTAQVYVDGVVSSDTHIGSFLGFAPMDESADCRDGDRRSRRRWPSITVPPPPRPLPGKFWPRALAYLGCAPDAERRDP